MVHGSAIDDVEKYLLPEFEMLAKDDMYQVRKSVGECLVDMSRSLMLLPFCEMASVSTCGGSGGGGGKKEKGRKEVVKDFSKMKKAELKDVLMDMRRSSLVHICALLLEESNRLVRQGMMQFLGPFIASFYPLEGTDGGPEEDGIINILRGRDHENMEGEMGVQFFPHANGMVNQLNPTMLTCMVAFVVSAWWNGCCCYCGGGSNGGGDWLLGWAAVFDSVVVV